MSHDNRSNRSGPRGRRQFHRSSAPSEFDGSVVGGEARGVGVGEGGGGGGCGGVERSGTTACVRRGGDWGWRWGGTGGGPGWISRWAGENEYILLRHDFPPWSTAPSGDTRSPVRSSGVGNPSLGKRKSAIFVHSETGIRLSGADKPDRPIPLSHDSRPTPFRHFHFFQIRNRATWTGNLPSTNQEMSTFIDLSVPNLNLHGRQERIRTFCSDTIFRHGRLPHRVRRDLRSGQAE